MNLARLPSDFQQQIQEFYNEAESALPEGIDEEAKDAWLVREILALSERARHRSRKMQVLLAGWTYQQQIWQMDVNSPTSFKEFLENVGNDHEGTKLTHSAISDLVATSEIILPFCESINIPMTKVINGTWAKFREAIPALRRAIQTSPEPEQDVRVILDDVKSLPNRDTVREKYRKSRIDKAVTGDYLQSGDKTVVALIVNAEDWPNLKSKLSRYTNWRTLLTKTQQGIVIHI